MSDGNINQHSVDPTHGATNSSGDDVTNSSVNSGFGIGSLIVSGGGGFPPVIHQKAIIEDMRAQRQQKKKLNTSSSSSSSSDQDSIDRDPTIGDGPTTYQFEEITSENTVNQDLSQNSNNSMFKFKMAHSPKPNHSQYPKHNKLN